MAGAKGRGSIVKALEAQLDEALMETFPASDPIAVGHPTGQEPVGSPIDRRAPVLDARDIAAARGAQDAPAPRSRPRRSK
jgi:hypothetical protein